MQNLPGQQELLWEGTSLYRVVTCNFAKPARPTIIVCEAKNLESKREYGTVDFIIEGCSNIHTRDTSSRTVQQVHVHVQLGVQGNSGNCDHREAVGSRQEVTDRTGKLRQINGTRLQRHWSGLRYIYFHSVSPKYLPQHTNLKNTQPVFPEYEREIIVQHILNFIFFKSNVKTI